jgi:hypothetical protein
MANEVFTTSGAGAAQGSATGSAWGPWGAAVGAIVGGILGISAGKNKARAKKFAQKAADTRRRQQTMQLAVQRRDVFRQMRIAQAQAVAAGASEDGVTSSAVQGASSSATAQGTAAVRYFDTQVDLDNQFQEYSKKAGKYAQKADDLMGLIGSSAGISTAIADAYGLSKQSTAAPAVNTSPYTSFNNTAAQTNMQNNSAFTSFGSSLDLNQ